jgi:hypothetical protein
MSLHPASGAAAATRIGMPPGLVHGTSEPSGIITRSFSTASVIDRPPP